MAIQLERPGSVTFAVVMLYLSLAAGAVRALFGGEAIISQIGAPMFVGVAVPILGLICLLVYLISSGRNWARILFLVMMLLGVPLVLFGVMQQITDGIAIDVFGLGQTCVQALATALLFLTPSSAWFRAMKASRMAELNALTAQALESHSQPPRPRAAAIRVKSRHAAAPRPDPGVAACPVCSKPVALPDAPGTYACPHCGKGIAFE